MIAVHYLGRAMPCSGLFQGLNGSVAQIWWGIHVVNPEW